MLKVVAPVATAGVATGIACACPSTPAVTSVAEKAPAGIEATPTLASGPGATTMDVDLSGMDKDNINNFPGSGCWKKYLGSQQIKAPTSYGNKPEGNLPLFSNDNSDLEGCLIINVDTSDTDNKTVRLELLLKENNGRFILGLWAHNNISTKESSGFAKIIKKSEKGDYEDAGIQQDKFTSKTTDVNEVLSPPASVFQSKIDWNINKGNTKDGWLWRRDCKNGQDRIGVLSSHFDRWSQKLFKKPDGTHWSTLFSGWRDKMGIWTKVT